MELLINIVIISAFCLGWRTITDDGSVLYFLRSPFEEVKNAWALFFLKPIILCVKCMPSFWGVLVYLSLNHHEVLHGDLVGFTHGDLAVLIIAVISSSFVSAYAWSKYE